MVWGDGFLEWYRRDEPEHLRRGRMGERAAKQELKKAGLKFLYANFRGEAGEIDLIFRDKRTLVFVEVKIVIKIVMTSALEMPILMVVEIAFRVLVLSCV